MMSPTQAVSSTDRTSLPEHRHPPHRGHCGLASRGLPGTSRSGVPRNGTFEYGLLARISLIRRGGSDKLAKGFSPSRCPTSCRSDKPATATVRSGGDPSPRPRSGRGEPAPRVSQSDAVVHRIDVGRVRDHKFGGQMLDRLAESTDTDGPDDCQTRVEHEFALPPARFYMTRGEAGSPSSRLQRPDRYPDVPSRIQIGSPPALIGRRPWRLWDNRD